MITKVCSKCKLELMIDEYQKDKSKKDGYRPECKLCRKKYVDENKHRFKEREAQYKRNDKLLNPEKYRERYKKYRENNKEKEKQRRKTYYENNKEKHIEYSRNKWKTDALYRMANNMRRRMGFFISSVEVISENKSKTFSIVGCSPKFLKEYLESMFSDGMTWENYGFYGWHIDHIIPVSSAKDEEELKKLCHYTNLQPLWCKDNLSKGSKIL
jgi:hypothetical protein